MRADQLFVFAGAGVSASPPASLPMFDRLRDEVLVRLGLDSYTDADDPRRAVAEGLAPEPFMSELRHGGLDVEAWLTETLTSEPNAVHFALAQLAAAGARVWTVNFDRLIEQADPSLDVVRWPETPSCGAQLVKPHGSVGGRMIVGSDEVLRGLGEPWRRQLAEDLGGRTAIFVGYSGRDLDFQPLWESMLGRAARVLWFDQPAAAGDPMHVEDEQRRRALLGDVGTREGRTRFVAAGPPPRGVPLTARPNAAADFVSWCTDRGLVSIDQALVLQMYERPRSDVAALSGELGFARAGLLATLGDYVGARRQRWELLRKAPQRGRAAKELMLAEMVHGTRTGRVLLGGLSLLPPVSDGWRSKRDRAARQRITALHRRADHQGVLRATRRIDEDTISTLLLLRAASVRMLGSLDEAVELGVDALRRARGEDHPVRAAHAAFQLAMALVWAERLDEARACLEVDLKPSAAIAANRWVAWAAHIDAQLAVRAGDTAAAERHLQLAGDLFRAEALMDGVVSTRLVELTVHRRRNDDRRFEECHASLLGMDDSSVQRWLWYSRRAGVTEVAASVELGEYLRVHRRDAPGACDAYRRAVESPWPIYRALGHLGLARCEAEPSLRRAHGEHALTTADRIGARLIARTSRETLDDDGTDDELFFC